MQGSTNESIFKSIGDLLAQDEFLNAQEDFLKSNAGLFSDQEENKLEYSEIHEGYVHLLDELIELKLKKLYSEQQVEDFYKAIKENVQAFENIDKDLMNRL